MFFKAFYEFLVVLYVRDRSFVFGTRVVLAFSYVFAVVHLISFDEGDNGGTGAEDDATEKYANDGPSLTYDQPAKGFARRPRSRKAIVGGGRRQAVPNTFFVVLLLASDEYELHIL